MGALVSVQPKGAHAKHSIQGSIGTVQKKKKRQSLSSGETVIVTQHTVTTELSGESLYDVKYTVFEATNLPMFKVNAFV